MFIKLVDFQKKYMYLEFLIPFFLLSLSQEKAHWSEQQEESSSWRQKLKIDFFEKTVSEMYFYVPAWMLFSWNTSS